MDKQTYQELLKDPRWIKRRNEILTRDKNTCQSCGAQDKYLHVHHLNYWDGFLPWEYPDDMLVTLCKDCHWNMHKNKGVSGMRVGDIWSYVHGGDDWNMNYIIYDVNSITQTIKVLGCDEGASVDSVFDDEWGIDAFKKKCHLVESASELNYLFPYWFNEIIENLNKTPPAFRYNIEQIITSNSILHDLYSDPQSYDDLLEEEEQHPITT